MEGKRKSDARPDRGDSDSLELWTDVLHDLGDQLKLPYAGLIIRFYSGSVATEAFGASRRRIPKAHRWHDALGSIEQDEVTIFSLGD